MTITFHCEHCGKKVSAPDEAGGRRGKCPRCAQHVFIPMPQDQTEEIPLTPVDQREENHRKALRMEELRLQQQLQEHQEASASDSPANEQNRTDSEVYIPSLPQTETGIPDLVRQYLILMAQGELDNADAVGGQIIAGGPKALKIVEQLAMEETLIPQLAKVPPTVIAGFYKKLLARFPR